MSTLTIILCIWAMVALCAILFIRGATSRYARPPQAEQRRKTGLSVAK